MPRLRLFGSGFPHAIVRFSVGKARYLDLANLPPGVGNVALDVGKDIREGRIPIRVVIEGADVLPERLMHSAHFP
jgi:hypothetical protein